MAKVRTNNEDCCCSCFSVAGDVHEEERFTSEQSESFLKVKTINLAKSFENLRKLLLVCLPGFQFSASVSREL